MYNGAAHFNPRSPHGERRVSQQINAVNSAFQPTLPARGATTRFADHKRESQYFNPRSPHGERQFPVTVDCFIGIISTHAPRTGSDDKSDNFDSIDVGISTHAPRTGSDKVYTSTGETVSVISTHAPRTGSDRPDCRHSRDGGEFQPTLPARGATPAKPTRP